MYIKTIAAVKTLEMADITRGVNFFQGQGGMKAGIDRHSRKFLLFCPISL